MPVFKNATIGRVSNGSMDTIPFADGDTVASLLPKAHLVLVAGEEVNDANGNPVSLSASAREMTYYIVRNMKNASK